MTQSTLNDINAKFLSLPSFLELEESIYRLSLGDDGSWHRMGCDKTPEGACAYKPAGSGDTITTSWVLFKEVNLWSECLLKAGVYEWEPGFIETFEDLLFAFTAAGELKEIENWDTCSFKELIGYIWNMTAIGLFTPPPTSSGPLETETARVVSFKKSVKVGGANSSSELSELMLNRLLTKFKSETIEFLGGKLAPNLTSTSSRRVVIVMNHENYGSFLEETLALIEDKTLGMTLSDKTTEVLKIILTANMLGQYHIGEEISSAFTVTEEFLPVLDHKELGYSQVFVSPKSMTDEELKLFIKFTRLYYQDVSDVDYEFSSHRQTDRLTKEVLKPAWASFTAATK